MYEITKKTTRVALFIGFGRSVDVVSQFSGGPVLV
jgi:hypothetical protein